MADLVDKLMDFESGEMKTEDIVPFIAELVKSKMAWSLQGMYGRIATRLIAEGKITTEGEVI